MMGIRIEAVVLKPGETFAGRSLVKLLGRGGMGEVWLAKKGGFKDVVKNTVIKVILSTASPKERAQARMFFEREIALAATLDHQNIARVYDFGVATVPGFDGGPEEVLWFEQEFIEGTDLSDVIHRSPQGVPVPVALHIIGEILQGLEVAHERQLPDGRYVPIVHRDIKPANIMISKRGTVHILDFGIAREYHDNRVTKTQFAGTPGYIAPEILMDVLPAPPSDQFSVGVVMFDLLTGGQPLFRGSQAFAVLQNTIECQIPPLAAFNRLVPPEVEAIMRRLLARDPSQRFPTTAEARRAILVAPGGRDASDFDVREYVRQLGSAAPYDAISAPALDADGAATVGGHAPRAATGSQLNVATRTARPGQAGGSVPAAESFPRPQTHTSRTLKLVAAFVATAGVAVGMVFAVSMMRKAGSSTGTARPEPVGSPAEAADAHASTTTTMDPSDGGAGTIAVTTPDAASTAAALPDAAPVVEATIDAGSPVAAEVSVPEKQTTKKKTRNDRADRTRTKKKPDGTAAKTKSKPLPTGEGVIGPDDEK